MGFEQTLMLIGATMAGTFFAFSVTHQHHPNRHLYTAFGVVGLSLIIVGFYRLSGM